MKPGTFTQLYTHLVFAVKHRECLLNKAHRKELFSYVSGIVTNLKHKSIIVGGYSDHIHIFIGQHPSLSISDTVSEIKRSSRAYIKNNKWFGNADFQWQDGYSAFSNSRSQVKDVFTYIENQEIHHKSNKFKDEYLSMLRKAEIEFDEKYLFDFYDDVEID